MLGKNPEGHDLAQKEVFPVKLKLLRFDTVYPPHYLQQKKEQWGDSIFSESRAQYRKRILSLGANFSDFYTYYLSELGWDAEEFILKDPLFLTKTASELYPFSTKLKNKWRRLRKIYNQDQYEQNIIRDYIEATNPHVMIIREHSGLPSSFWAEFRKKMLVVSRIACPLPRDWNPSDFDLFYTVIPAFKSFFEAHSRPAILSPSGFDPRILDRLEKKTKKYAVSFVGCIFPDRDFTRHAFFESIAKKTDLHWWGAYMETLPAESSLRRSYQGVTGGVEMFQILADSAVVLNDYSSTNMGLAVNMRICETLGVGSFLLTRQARNLTKDFPKDLFATFENATDCLEKIQYFLKHEKEREEIAHRGQEFILQHYSYQEITKKMNRELKNFYQKKFAKAEK